MADMMPNPRPTRPLPTGWSDSSEEGCGKAAAAGGGRGDFDDSSSDGGWGSGGDGGGGMRAFERSSAENTRKALLRNDVQLLRPTRLTSAQGLPPGGLEDPDESSGFVGGGSETKVQSPQQLPTLRYVPGDPFANEEADVDAWAKHFTYLSVVPAKGVGRGQVSSPENIDNDGGSGGRPDSSSDVGGGDGLSKTRSAMVESPPHHRHTGAPDMMEVGDGDNGEEPDRGDDEGDVEEKRNASQEGDEKTLDVAAAAAAAATSVAVADDDLGDAEGMTVTPERARPGRRGKPEEEVRRGEEVFASHGVYEEYLAYDCRPPDEEGYGDGSGALDSAGDLGATEQAEWSGSNLAPGATSLPPATGGSRRGAAAALARLGTPQRELREEIMDRLFDEMWRRITPGLLSQLRMQEQQLQQQQ